MFCKNCGNQIDGAAFCPNCGCKVEKEAKGDKNNDYTESAKKENQLLTIEETKKIEYYKIVFMSLVLIFILVSIFMPIFKFGVEDVLLMDLDDISNMVNKQGKAGFSWFDEFKLIYKQVTAENSTVNFSKFISSYLILLPILIIMCISIVARYIYHILNSVYSLNNIEEARKKYCEQNKEDKEESFVAILIDDFSTVFLIFIGFVCDSLGVIGHDIIIRRINDGFELSKFRPIALIIPILFVAIFVVKYKAKKYNKKLKENIARRKKEEKENNKRLDEERKREAELRKKAHECEEIFIGEGE